MSEITNFKGQAIRAAPEDDPDAAVDLLIRTVGERVRKARELKGLPRRVVSEVSGVSPRYLAQLEAGEGNISIGLLMRVAIALDHRIEWLVGEEDPWTSETLRAADLYRAAPAALLAAARNDKEHARQQTHGNHHRTHGGSHGMRGPAAPAAAGADARHFCCCVIRGRRRRH